MRLTGPNWDFTTKLDADIFNALMIFAWREKGILFNIVERSALQRVAVLAGINELREYIERLTGSTFRLDRRTICTRRVSRRSTNGRGYRGLALDIIDS